MSSVNAWRERLAIPTHALGSEDPFPPLQREGPWTIYPYPMLDDLAGERVLQDWEAVCLENEYLRLTVLPELGGHLYSLFDKVGGREVFYRNNVIRPARIALRGAWCSGGIEWNFPIGHSTTTVSPVDCLLESHDDGSASITVGNIEQVTRMQWSVRLTLHPGRAALQTDLRLYNRTPLFQRYYFWSNSAVPAADDLRLVYPAHAVRTSRGIHGYPEEDGVDLSLYRNHPNADDIFTLGVTEDYFGCTYEGSDHGLVHVGDHHQACGKKFFTWGTADSGMMWAKLLTESDGQYVEIQSGRFHDQSTWEFLQPHAAVAWREWWYPVRGLGGWCWANEHGAVQLGSDRGGMRAAVMTVAPHREATLLVERAGRVVAESVGPVAPEQPLWAEGRSEAGREALTLRLLVEGRELVRYQPQPPPPDAVARAQRRYGGRAPATGPEATAAELVQAGRNAERELRFLQAAQLYEDALRRDPGCAEAPAWLGALQLRRGLSVEALPPLEAALDADPHCGPALYHYGLAAAASGSLVEAEEAFGRLARLGELGGAAHYALAELGMRQSRFGFAAEHGRLAALADPGDAKAHCLRAAALRALGDSAAAGEACGTAIGVSPLCALARAEQWFLARRWGDGEPELAGLECALREAQSYVELAADYVAWGFLDEAAEVLALALAVGQDTPMVRFWLAHCLEGAGRSMEAVEHWAAGATQSPRFVFPHRLEEIAVLQQALERLPDSPWPSLYLGNLLHARGRVDEAQALWRRSADLEPTCAVTHRNLGLAAQRAGELGEAQGEYEAAVAHEPDEYRLHLAADDVRAALGLRAEDRLAHLLGAPEGARQKVDLVTRLIALHNAVGHYDEAIALLDSHQFAPWEGMVAVRTLYVDALVGRGQRRLAGDDPAGALADFERSLEYPDNIAVGRPSRPAHAKLHFLAGQAAAAAGDQERAAAHWRAAWDEPHDPPSEPNIWRARAARALGAQEAAEELLAPVAAHAQSLVESGRDEPTGRRLLALVAEAR